MSHGRLIRLAPALLALTALAILGGCGGNDGSDGSDVVLATIGDREVTAEYYVDRLQRLEKNQLPRDEDGNLVDTATLAGKRAFLDVIIDKELMVAKALELGYDKDTAVESALGSLMEYNAMGYFWQDAIGDPSKYVSNADLDHYYSRLGERRDCDFLITDFRAEAEQALADFEAGAPRSELVASYHSPDLREGQQPTISVSWGQYRDEFEEPLFAVAEGEVAGPIETEHGWWLLRVNDVVMEEKPDLESIKGKVLASISQRNQNLRRQELIREIREERDFVLDEEALAIVFEGLPENEQVIDPRTNQPVPREQLQPLDVPSESLGRVLLGYDLSSGRYEMTIGDFKAQFDRQNAFERPKRSELLGGVRTKLTNNAERAIMLDEARQRGYFEDPRVEEESMRRVEEVLVDKVHQEVVTFDEYVSPEQLQAFFEEYGHQYHKPERRSGHMVRCVDQETAAQARQAIVDEGLTWKAVNRRFGNSPELEQRFGRLVQIREDETGPVRDRLFAMEIDEVSEPFPVEDGYAVVQLDQVHAPEEPVLDELAEQIGQRIKNRRQDEALRALLDRWAEEFGVTVHEERLADTPSWDEAYQAAQLEKLEMPAS